MWSVESLQFKVLKMKTIHQGPLTAPIINHDQSVLQYFHLHFKISPDQGQP